jgi:hypothetical protein
VIALYLIALFMPSSAHKSCIPIRGLWESCWYYIGKYKNKCLKYKYTVLWYDIIYLLPFLCLPSRVEPGDFPQLHLHRPCRSSPACHWNSNWYFRFHWSAEFSISPIILYFKTVGVIEFLLYCIVFLFCPWAYMSSIFIILFSFTLFYKYMETRI